MAVTEWADVSEHNGRPVDSSYPRPWLAYRACDGTYEDSFFTRNDDYARRSSQLVGRIVYLVYPRSVGASPWESVFRTITQLIGDAHEPRLVLMMDVESWNRAELRKDFSEDLEALRGRLVDWLHAARPKWQTRWPFGTLYRSRDERRVIGYGNRGDLMTQARHVKWSGIILADYSDAATPRTLNGWKVIGRQYTDRGKCPPWGVCDMNRAATGPRGLARRLGLGRFRWTI